MAKERRDADGGRLAKGAMRDKRGVKLPFRYSDQFAALDSAIYTSEAYNSLRDRAQLVFIDLLRFAGSRAAEMQKLGYLEFSWGRCQNPNLDDGRFRRGLNELERKGFIEIERRKGCANRVRESDAWTRYVPEIGERRKPEEREASKAGRLQEKNERRAEHRETAAKDKRIQNASTSEVEDYRDKITKATGVEFNVRSRAGAFLPLVVRDENQRAQLDAALEHVRAPWHAENKQREKIPDRATWLEKEIERIWTRSQKCAVDVSARS